MTAHNGIIELHELEYEEAISAARWAEKLFGCDMAELVLVDNTDLKDARLSYAGSFKVASGPVDGKPRKVLLDNTKAAGSEGQIEIVLNPDYHTAFIRRVDAPHLVATAVIPDFTKEHINAVAIQYGGKVWSLPRPKRHADVIRHIAMKTGKGIEGPEVQGFMTNKNRFVDRREGLEIALACNQVLNRNDIRANQLFTEDLW